MNDGLSFEAQWIKLNTLLDFQHAHDNELIIMALCVGGLRCTAALVAIGRALQTCIPPHCCKTVCRCVLSATGSNTETIALYFMHSMIT